MEFDSSADVTCDEHLKFLCKIGNIDVQDIVDETHKLKYPKVSNKPIVTFIKRDDALKIIITRLFLRIKTLEKKHSNRLKKYSEYNNIYTDNTKISDEMIRAIDQNKNNHEIVAKLLPQPIILKEIIKYEIWNCIPKQKYNILKMQVHEIGNIMKKEIERFSCVLCPDIIEDNEWTICCKQNKLFKVPDSHIVLLNTTMMSCVPKIIKNIVNYMRNLCKYKHITCFLHEDVNYDIYWFIFCIKIP